jgi:hypothetical protein
MVLLIESRHVEPAPIDEAAVAGDAEDQRNRQGQQGGRHPEMRGGKCHGIEGQDDIEQGNLLREGFKL